VTDTAGNTATCTATVTVEDTLGPEVTCPEDQISVLEEGATTFEVPDYFATGDASAIDNCTDPVIVFTQDPLPGELLEIGTYTVTLCATDAFGNENCCEFQLTVDDNLSVEDAIDSSLSMYPNPARDQVFISNPNGIRITNIALYDLAGRLVSSKKQSQALTEILIDISDITSGVYVVRIESALGTLHKQLIKR